MLNVEATGDASGADCEVDSSSGEGPCFVDAMLEVTRNILMATPQTESDGTRSVMEETYRVYDGVEAETRKSQASFQII